MKKMEIIIGILLLMGLSQQTMAATCAAICVIHENTIGGPITKNVIGVGESRAQALADLGAKCDQDASDRQKQEDNSSFFRKGLCVTGNELATSYNPQNGQEDFNAASSCQD